ncbi:MAG: 1-deoxy-D-xylulose-5-phosphate synthase [Clostridia bacterium]|nr:1-deoxy-D-xylulose-5-phosphate synthase [Clostridia bacterium]
MSKLSILENINSPGDIKKLNTEELEYLCEEIRDFLIENVLKTGGHLASNLGTVELTLALHRVFDFPYDHLIFDVGHQCYTHKIVTGRKHRFSELRKRGGMSGFTKTSESKYDCFGAGHSSTSVSAAIGFAEAERLKNSDKYTVALLGDGAFTGGMVHEALNNCRKDLKLIIVLNENEMSISKNIGAFAKIFSKIRASKGYYRTKRKTANFILKLPLIGDKLFSLIKSAKQSLKNKMYKSNYFEDLGLYYLGPVDGNDTIKVERLLNEAKNARQSTVVHVRTLKGKGYPPAEENPGKYHSVSPFGTEKTKNFSVMAGELLTDLAKNNGEICAVTAAMAEGTGLKSFATKIPNRFFDVGIAEEHALTFSAGLAANGMRPYFAVYSSFLQRGYDNIIHDIALQKLPVTILVDRAGISSGDGPTHHGIFDVAFLSQIPNIEIFAPSCFDALKHAIEYSKDAACPIAIRYSNSGDPKAVYERFEKHSDNMRVLFPAKPCKRIIITYGKIVSEALSAFEEIDSSDEDGCGIILLEKLKPYGEIANEISEILPNDIKNIVFLEEGIKNGGAGMILREYLNLPSTCGYSILAIDDVFDTPANTGSIYSDFNIGKENIISEFENQTRRNESLAAYQA